jgi:hypothetical protein
VKWEELQPGDQLLPLGGFRSDVLNREPDPMVVLSVAVRANDGKHVSPFGQRDIVDLLFLNTRTAETIKEVRYTSGSAALGYEIVRAGRRIA